MPNSGNSATAALRLAGEGGFGRRGGLSPRLRIFCVTWLAYAGFYLCRKNFSVLMPFLQNEAGISKMRLADILLGYSICYAAGQFLMGSLADRFSPRAVVASGMAAAAIANIGMGADPAFGMLLGLGMVNGLAQSTGWPGLVKTMAAWFEPHERGAVMGWWTTNYVLGGFLATVFASWVISGGDWGRGFVLPALALFLVCCVFLLLVRDRPEGAAKALDAGRGTVLAGYASVARQPVVWATAGAAMLIKITRYSFLYWLPLYLNEQLRYRPDQAGYLSSAYELAGIAGALTAGHVSDRYAGSRRYPVACVMLGGLAIACLFHGQLSRLGWGGTLAAVSAAGFMTYGPDTLLQGAATQDAGGRDCAGSAAGLVNGIASCGQLLSPYLVAYAATRWGWDALFSGFVGVAGAAAMLTGLFWNHQPASAPAQTESA